MSIVMVTVPLLEYQALVRKAALVRTQGADARPVAWRARGYAQFKTGKPGEWRYYHGADKPKLNDPECCDIEPLGVISTAPRPVACPECGGSLTTWKCTCEPIWPGYATRDTVRSVYATRDAASSDAQSAAMQELENIVKAKRFDHEHFEDDTAFADWVQSRARACLRGRKHD